MTRRPGAGLFRPGYFSIPRPDFAALTAAQARPVRDVLARHYPKLRVGQISQVKAFGLNSSNWKIRTDRGVFILKRASIEKTSLSRQAVWTQKLATGDFPTVRFLPDANSSLVVRDGEHMYCLSRFENGSYLGDSMGRWEDLLRWELTLLRYCRRHPPQAGGRGWSRRDFMTAEERLAVARLRGGRLPGLRRDDAAYVLQKHEELEEMHRRGRRDLRRGLFHIDIHPLNVLFRDDKLDLLADFDSFCMTTIEISLGFSFFKCARELLVGLPQTAFLRRMRRLERTVGRRFGRSFAELLAYGQIDLMKRLVSVLAAGPASPWSFMLETQLKGLREADAMIAACVSR